MRLKKLIHIITITLISCNVIKNPYYKMSIGLPHAYLNDAANKVYKIESEVLIEGNTLQEVLPIELGGKEVKGSATYEIELNERVEIQKINLVAIRIEDSIRNSILFYQKYDPSKRIIESPNEQIQNYNKYFLQQIMKLRFKQVSPPSAKNFVYCNFIF
jgi:hypothetical protein